MSDLVASSGFGCFREFSSGFGKSNFAFMIVIVELHLGRELIFGGVNLVSMWKSLFCFAKTVFVLGSRNFGWGYSDIDFASDNLT